LRVAKRRAFEGARGRMAQLDPIPARHGGDYLVENGVDVILNVTP
jgi:hypothetical protein